ncbi:(deoxy)nucleoside triphosphate pyrophosphohydrolase [Cytobacillus praedii]|uniref:(deoxy)nucleoside triphosphate pyrophosphohydrolase n=1 Tax=Cytobacillus praedii TaxID=1742358 RepID=UPI003F81A1AE
MKKDIYVVGAVIIEKGKVLCAQRGQDEILPYKWEFPGGKIEAGETPQEAVKREIKEELLCHIEIGKEIDHTIYEYDFGTVHLSTFFCKLIEGEPQLTEHLEIKWVEPNKLESLDWAPADLPTVNKLSGMALIK